MSGRAHSLMLSKVKCALNFTRLQTSLQELSRPWLRFLPFLWDSPISSQAHLQDESIVVQSPATAYEMAQAYMQEIAASPFSFEESPPASPQLEPTSKPTEIEDNLFDDEPGSAVSLAPPVPQQPIMQHSQRSIETQTSFSFSR